MKMSIENMIEIKEGPGLDEAVANAIGLIFTHEINGSNVKCWSDPRSGLRRTFKPSTDLNDAFYAAESARMFLSLNHLSSGWMATAYIMNGNYATGETASLAICAAILKVTSDTEWLCGQ